jgi:hypothetical protein
MEELKQQIITRRVDINKFAGTGGYEIKHGKRVVNNHYSEVRRCIKRKINPDTEHLIIKIIPVIKDEYPLNEYYLKKWKNISNMDNRIANVFTKGVYFNYYYS